MIASSCDIFADYAQVNAEIDNGIWTVTPKPEYLSNDRNTEDPVLILGIRKWIDSGRTISGPNLECAGLRMAELVCLTDKYDLFIYVAE